VPPGLLDSVFAAALEPAADEELGVAPMAGTADRKSWWARFRKTLLLPALAVAGSAALILVIVQPTADDLGSVAINEKRDDAQKGAAAERSLEAPAAADGAPTDLLEAEAEDAAAAEPAAAAPDAAKELVEIATSRSSSKTPAPATTPAQVAGGDVASGVVDRKKAEEQAQSEAKTKNDDGEADTPRWDAISRGDRARRDGDCATAKAEYETALSDSDDRVQARANAGLGMCEAKLGRSSSAQELYERARNLDPEIDSFIGNEKPGGAEAPAAKPRPKAKKKRSGKRKSADYNEPFGE
jgi:tetratricopeptide (TPR) repeat protein